MAVATSRRDSGSGRRPLPCARRSRERIESIVLDHLGRAGRPLGAYEISWRATVAGDPVIPNQVYRTLARLIALGKVRRLESLSAYVLKIENGGNACLICDRCHATRVIDAPDIIAKLERCAQGKDFHFQDAIVEIHGHCVDCAKTVERVINLSIRQSNQ